MTYDGRRGRPASLHCVYFWFQYRVGRGVGVGGGVHGIGSVSIFSSGGVFRVPADRGELRGPPRPELFFPKLFFSNTQSDWQQQNLRVARCVGLQDNWTDRMHG